MGSSLSTMETSLFGSVKAGHRVVAVPYSSRGAVFLNDSYQLWDEPDLHRFRVDVFLT